MDQKEFLKLFSTTLVQERHRLNSQIKEVKRGELSVDMMKISQVLRHVDRCPHEEGISDLEEIRTRIPDALSWYKPQEFSRVMRSVGFSRVRVKLDDLGWVFRWDIAPLNNISEE